MVTGEIDMDTALALADAIAAAGGDLVVDMSGVSFLDSSGLRVLIQAQLAFEERGSSFTIADPSPQVARLFEMSQLNDYFDVRRS